MAGIPLTAGFMGKWAVFTVAMSAGAWPVVLVAILSSIISVFFYVRLILLLFFQGEMPEEKEVGPDYVADGGGVATATRTEHATVTKPSIVTTGVIAVSAALTLLLGVVPGPVLDLLADAGQFIR
jgi:NADH-quinone oxidoreductase subunit N